MNSRLLSGAASGSQTYTAQSARFERKRVFFKSKSKVRITMNGKMMGADGLRKKIRLRV